MNTNYDRNEYYLNMDAFTWLKYWKCEVGSTLGYYDFSEKLIHELVDQAVELRSMSQEQVKDQA